MKQIEIVDSDLNKIQKSADKAESAVEDLTKDMGKLNKTAQQASGGLDKLDDSVENLNNGATKFNISQLDMLDTMENLTRISAGFVGAVEVMQGSLRLMGVDNEFVNKSLEDMATLLQITDGLNSIAEMIHSFKELKTAVNAARVAVVSKEAVDKTANATTIAGTVATKALAGAQVFLSKALNIAKVGFAQLTAVMAANPIMAVATAVTALGSALYYFISTSNEAEEKEKALAEANRELKYSMEQLNEQTETQVKLLQAQGKSELEILNVKLAAAREAWLAQEAFYNKRKQEGADAEELAKIKETWASYAKQMRTLKTDIQAFNIKAQHEAEKQRQDEIEREKEDAQRKLENTKAAHAREIDELKQHNQDVIKTLRDNAASLREETQRLQNINNVANKSQREKDIAEEKQSFKELLDSKVAILEQAQDIIAKYDTNASDPDGLLKQQYEEAKQVVIDYGDWLEAATKSHNDNIKEINKQYDDEELSEMQEHFQKKMDLLSEQYDRERELKNARFDIENDKLSLEGDSDRDILSNEVKRAEFNLESFKKQYEEIAQMSPFEGQKEALEDLQIEIGNATNKVAKAKQELNEFNIDDSFRIFEDAVSVLNSSGDVISSKWVGVFQSFKKGFKDIGKELKKSGKSWKTYGKLATASLQVASGIMGALADQQEATSKKSFERQKKMQIAGATMDMLGGIVSVWMSAFSKENHGPLWKRLAEAISMTAAFTANGIMQIQKIKKTTFDGGGADVSSAASTPAPTALQSINGGPSYTTDIQGASTESDVTDSRVYVLESDITNAQNKVRVSESEATF